MTLLFWLLVGHAVCDYPLQGDFLARGKNQTNPLPGIPWWQCLIWHAAIHSGAVALVTGSIALGLAEFSVHLITDYGKSAGWFDFNSDQGIHVACKFLWALLSLRGLA